MASVTFKRGTKAEIEATAKQDGQILMETDQTNNKMYVDLQNNNRVRIGNSNVDDISGITDSLTATSSNIALSAAGGNNLQGQIDTLNSNLIKTKEIAIDVTVTESGGVLGSYYGYFNITIPSEIINNKIIAFIPISATSITSNGSCGILGLYSADSSSNNFSWTVSTPTSGTYICRFIVIFI